MKIKTPIEILKPFLTKVSGEYVVTESCAIKAIESYHSQFEDKWIDIGESWPKINERVLLVIDSLGQKYTCIGKRGEDGLFYKDKGSLSKQLEIVTHWMPLPSNPK